MMAALATGGRFNVVAFVFGVCLVSGFSIESTRAELYTVKLGCQRGVGDKLK